MDNKKAAEILEEIGTLLEIKGENQFKCRAYHNAARIVAGLTTDIGELIQAGGLKKIKGIGEGLAEKLIEFVETGKIEYYEKLRKSLPEGLMEMLRIHGLGPKRIKILYEQLNIKTIDQLENAAKNHKLEHLDGFGEKIAENILHGIELWKKHSDKFLYPIAKEAAERILNTLKENKYVNNIKIAGSIRRCKEIIGDIDILISAKSSDTINIMDTFAFHTDVDEVIAKGDTKTSVRLKSGISCDLRIVSEMEFPFALNYFTGSKEHNVEMRSLAKKFGLSLNEYGFSKIGSETTRGESKEVVKCRSEADIYKTLKLQYIPPELRENMGEIDAAAQQKIPVLIENSDLKGTFHCHTTYSDGVNTLEEMAKAAQDLGWQYLGIAEHSKSAAYAGGLSEKDVKNQMKEIDLLNSRFKDFRILKGIEVDIHGDGKLDYPDRLLQSFDFVICAIHSRFNLSEKEMTKRIIKGMKNKFVTMLAHPTGRLLLEREAYAVNMIEVILAAADYGKMIEINSHPSRFDLDWRMCKFAKENGVKLVINPDAHNTDGLKDVFFGVEIARKGWLEKSNVFNTFALKEIKKHLKI